ncbi:MAG: recombination regulator RecX [Actinobacteria bacterium]|nr:recombination regulator RecX [Actinomycetota bacterium]
MTEITAIKKTKRGLSGVFLDDRFWRSFPPEFAAENNLVVGRKLVPDEITAFERAGDCREASDRALVFLDYRARSVMEVRRRLAKVGFSREILDEVVDRLHETGYLDDRMFAREWIDSRSRSKGYGRNRLKSELKGRGVTNEIIEEELAAACNSDAEEARALFVGQARLVKIQGLGTNVARRKLADYLIRKGYDRAIASRTAKGLVNGLFDLQINERVSLKSAGAVRTNSLTALASKLRLIMTKRH